MSISESNRCRRDRVRLRCNRANFPSSYDIHQSNFRLPNKSGLHHSRLRLKIHHRHVRRHALQELKAPSTISLPPPTELPPPQLILFS